MVQPRAVVQRVHAAPSVDENDQRRRNRLWRVGLKDPILFIAGTVAIFRHLGVTVLFSARSYRWLCGWSRSLVRKSRQGKKYNREKRSYVFSCHVFPLPSPWAFALKIALPQRTRSYAEHRRAETHHERVATTSRYSASAEVVPSVARLCFVQSSSRSFLSAACRPSSREPNALNVGP